MTKVIIDRFDSSYADNYTVSNTYYAPLMVPVLPIDEDRAVITDPSVKPKKFIEVASKVTCKNYIAEAVFKEGVGVNPRTYRSRLSEEFKASLDTGYYILYRFNSEETKNKVKKKLKSINNFEKKVGIKELTEFYDVEGRAEDLVVYAGPTWSYSNLLLSIHIQIIRICVYERKGNLSLFNFIKKLINDNRNSNHFTRDMSYFSASFYAGIDFEELLTNYKKYIPEWSRYSGMCDSEILKTANDFTRNQPVNITVPLYKRVINDRSMVIEQSVSVKTTALNSRIHDNLGIYRFSEVVKLMNDLTDEELLDLPNSRDNSYLFSIMGCVWAYRYVLNKRGLINE